MQPLCCIQKTRMTLYKMRNNKINKNVYTSEKKKKKKKKNYVTIAMTSGQN